MKWSLVLPLLGLASCNTHEPVRLVGKDGTEVNLGKATNFASKSYVNVGFDKYGRPRMTRRDDSEAVPLRAVDAAAALGAGMVYAGVEKAADASAAAVSKHAATQTTKQAGIQAALEAERIKAGVETTRILNPVTP